MLVLWDGLGVTMSGFVCKNAPITFVLVHDLVQIFSQDCLCHLMSVLDDHLIYIYISSVPLLSWRLFFSSSSSFVLVWLVQGAALNDCNENFPKAVSVMFLCVRFVIWSVDSTFALISVRNASMMVTVSEFAILFSKQDLDWPQDCQRPGVPL